MFLIRYLNADSTSEYGNTEKDMGFMSPSIMFDSIKEWILSTNSEFKIGISSNLADITLNPFDESKNK